MVASDSFWGWAVMFRLAHGPIELIRRSAPWVKRRFVKVMAVSELVISITCLLITGPVSIPGASNIKEIPVTSSPALMLETTGVCPRYLGNNVV